MNDELYYDPNLSESPRLWFPSQSLRGQLLLGAGAMLASGSLSAVATLAEQEQGQVQGFTTGHALSLASVVPLAYVWWIYRGVADEVGNYSLCKSSGCLFGSLFLLQLLDLTEPNVLPAGFDVAVWILVGGGLIALLVFAFSSPSKAAAASTKEDRVPRKASRAGWGGLGILLFIVIKIGLKFVLVAGLKGAGYQVAVVVLLVLGVIAFFVWFAVCKIRLRGQLGGLAMMVGVVELLGLIGASVFAICFVVALMQVWDQPGFDEQRLKEWGAPWGSALIWSLVSARLAWAALHAILFLTWWIRYDPNADWLLDRQERDKQI
jgi:hypothetical protein